MSLLNCCVLLIFVSLCAVLVSVESSAAREVTATVGHYSALNFNYRGRTTYVRCYYLKDGRFFRADGHRVLQRLGRIYFSKVAITDAGVYQIVVRGYRTYYKEAIKLIGKYNYLTI